MTAKNHPNMLDCNKILLDLYFVLQDKWCAKLVLTYSGFLFDVCAVSGRLKSQLQSKCRLLTKPSCDYLNGQVDPFIFVIMKHRLDRNQKDLLGSSSTIVSKIQRSSPIKDSHFTNRILSISDGSKCFVNIIDVRWSHYRLFWFRISKYPKYWYDPGRIRSVFVLS